MSANENAVPTDFSRVDPVPYVLRVGVTGHRALKDESAVRIAVEGLIRKIDQTLRRAVEEPRSGSTSKLGTRAWFDRLLLGLVRCIWWRMPVTPGYVPRERQAPLQWRVVSALAKGADQVVADVVLKDLYGSLSPVLPFTPRVYERDFETPKEREAFHHFLADSPEPWAAEDGEPLSAEQRAQAYRLAGERMVDESDFVIAVWDGEPARGEGGTGEIVAYAISKDVPVYWIHSNDPSRAPRLLAADEDGESTEADIPKTAKEIAPRYHQLCAYFRDPAYRESDYLAIYERELNFVTNKAKNSDLDSEGMRAAIHHRLSQHAYADHLALQHQALHLRSTITIILCAALAVTAAAVHLLAFTHTYWLIGFEIAFMVGAAVLLRVSIREGWHEKWLYDRYLAERLRSLMFREGLGHPPTEPNSIRELLPFYEGPAAWVDLVLRSHLPGDASAIKADEPAQLRQFLNEAWIDSQGGWHGRNVGKKRKLQRRFHRTSFALFALTLLSAVLHWFHIGHEGSPIYLHGLPEAIAILAVTLPAWGGALHGIAHLMDYGRIAERSDRMHIELGKLVREMETAENAEVIGDIAKRADELMAMENLEWMMTLAHRKPELHV